MADGVNFDQADLFRRTLQVSHEHSGGAVPWPEITSEESQSVHRGAAVLVGSTGWLARSFAKDTT